MKPVELEYFGEKLNSTDVDGDTIDAVAKSITWTSSQSHTNPQHIILEPGDGTRYEFVVAYHPATGLYFMPLGKPYVFVVNIDLDFIARATSFEDHYWPEFVYINKQPIVNGHTLAVYKWYLWNLAIAMVEEINA